MNFATPVRMLLVGCVCLVAVGAGQAAPGVTIDGRPLVCPSPPVNYQGAVMLPMRSIFTALQAEVRWLPKEQKLEARRGEQCLELWLGTPVALVNRAPVQLDTPPLLIAGTAYVPLRLIAQTFGASVRWDQPSQTASIETQPRDPAAARVSPSNGTPDTLVGPAHHEPDKSVGHTSTP